MDYRTISRTCAAFSPCRSELARENVNDYTDILQDRGVLKFFASSLAPTHASTENIVLSTAGFLRNSSRTEKRQRPCTGALALEGERFRGSIDADKPAGLVLP